MVTTPKGEFLVVIFRPSLTLALLEALPRDGLLVDGANYRPVPKGDSAAFYDWLRDRSGRVLGVRHWPSEPNLPIQAIGQLPYVRLGHDGSSVEVYFGDSREVDDDQSDDQAFGGSTQFVSESGDFAIAFETYFLSESEVASIREARAGWASITTPPVDDKADRTKQ
jgi:hypothetical protein